MSDTLPQTLPAPVIERVRHELKRRNLVVKRRELLTPHMLRLTLSGPDLADFTSASPDDHLKVFVTDATGEEQMRDYTPRRFDRAARELVLDFALHEAGPATAWALAARPGDPLRIGGPRGSQVIRGQIAHWLLIGDESALPAIARRIDEATPGTRITAVIAVPGPQDEQTLQTAADLTLHWVHRPMHAAADPSALLAAVMPLTLGSGSFAWIAAEALVAQRLRKHFLEDRGHAPGWLKASGYWVQGTADAKENFD